MKVVLATNNAHKVREIKALIRHLAIDIYTLLDFPNYKPLPEEGKTFEEIAIKKAVSAAKELDMYAIADDSGLVVPAIGGEPGVLSARYAGPNATDKDNRLKLLERMKNVHNRTAYFDCAIAFASPSGLIKCVKGSVEGTIIDQAKGGHGFGYDPLFVKHDYNQTFAELSEATKNRVSHRAKALQKMLILLESKATSSV